MIMNEKIITIHEMIETTNSILNFRDPYTYSHSERVAAISLIIAQDMELSGEAVDSIHMAAHLHDIGKIGVPDDILKKPGKLEKKEIYIIQKHSVIGHSILRKIPLFKNIAEIVLCHHERYDGRGYPNKLNGENIPLESRIIAIADSFDAMTSNRPYRKGMPFESAVNEVNAHIGDQFCPLSVKHFNHIVHKIPQAFAIVENAITANNIELDFILEQEDILHSIGVDLNENEG